MSVGIDLITLYGNGTLFFLDTIDNKILHSNFCLSFQFLPKIGEDYSDLILSSVCSSPFHQVVTF